MLAGLPFESWFKSSVREDMDDLIGDATVATLNEVKAKTEALLRGERKVTGPVVVETDMNGAPDDDEEQPTRRVRRRRRADQA